MSSKTPQSSNHVVTGEQRNFSGGLKEHAFTDKDLREIERIADVFLWADRWKAYPNARAIWISPRSYWVEGPDPRGDHECTELDSVLHDLFLLVGGGSVFWDEESHRGSLQKYWDQFDMTYQSIIENIEIRSKRVGADVGGRPPPRRTYRFKLGDKTRYAVSVGDMLSSINLLDDATNFYISLDLLEPFERPLTEIAELAGVKEPDSAELVRALKAVVGIWLGEPLDAEGLAKVFAASSAWQQEMPDLPIERFKSAGDEHILQFLDRVWKSYLYYGFADLNDLKKVDSEAFNSIPWPSVKFSNATGDLKSNVEKFLETYWKDLIAVGIATRRVIRDRDESLENGILNRQRKNKELGPIPAEIRPATKEELNNRAAEAIRVPKRHQARLAGTQAGRLRANLKNLTLHKT